MRFGAGGGAGHVLRQAARFPGNGENGRCAIRHRFVLDEMQIETESAVSVLVHLPEAQRLLKADAPCRCGRDKTERAHEEYGFLEELLPYDPFHGVREERRLRNIQIPRQGPRTNHRAIVKLDRFRRAWGLLQSAHLQFSDVLDEAWFPPWLGDALRLASCNEVGRGFFHNAVAQRLQVAEDGRLP
jgi:hypothetical protein